MRRDENINFEAWKNDLEEKAFVSGVNALKDKLLNKFERYSMPSRSRPDRWVVDLEEIQTIIKDAVDNLLE